MDKATLLGIYPTISQLTFKYSADTIPLYATRGEDCVMTEKSPRIMDVLDAYPDSRREMDRLIGNVLAFICKACNVRDANEEQMNMARQIIITKYKTMKMSEFLLFAFQFVSGEYEKLYGGFDIQAVVRSIGKFIEWRNQVISKHDTRKGQKTGQVKDGRGNYLIYLTELQKAVYGDQNAREYLRIESDRDMAIAVAMCVKRGDFPDKILDRLDPEYNEIVKKTLEWNISFGKSSRV